MDIFATDKAVELYAAEMKRRIEQLEKTVKEKEEAIQKHKGRERKYEAALLIVFLSIVIGGYLAMNNVLCRYATGHD